MELQKFDKDMSLVERLKAKKSIAITGDAALILDISGSMNSDCEPGKTKMQALRDVIGGLQGDPAVIIFSYDARLATKNTIPLHGTGGTCMAKAINLAKSQGFQRAVMITDGEANDPNETIEAVRNFDLKILYVGPGPKPPFLDRISKDASQEDLKAQKNLTAKVQLLLK